MGAAENRISNHQIALNFQFDALRISTAAQPIRAGKKHLGALVNDQAAPGRNLQIPLDDDRAGPVHLVADRPGPARLHHVHHHGRALPAQP